MAVASMEITRRAPYRAGERFGEAGAYERLDGVVRFAVDPGAVANSEIVDLELAPRGADGLVEFEADFCILRPGERSRGNGGLFFDVSNRGGKPAMALFNSFPPPLEPTDEIPA